MQPLRLPFFTLGVDDEVVLEEIAPAWFGLARGSNQFGVDRLKFFATEVGVGFLYVVLVFGKAGVQQFDQVRDVRVFTRYPFWNKSVLASGSLFVPIGPYLVSN